MGTTGGGRFGVVVLIVADGVKGMGVRAQAAVPEMLPREIAIIAGSYRTR